ncbi:hypothetical protein [Ralstonia syzygii]|nr:hypothetical protein [Ralstonia syzygii]
MITIDKQQAQITLEEARAIAERNALATFYHGRGYVLADRELEAEAC